MPDVVQNDWINRRRLREAINQFGEHKTSGPDGLKPLVLQHLPDKALDKLLPIQNASLGYPLKTWRKSDVVFIPKPAKKDYGDPRAFRPISLTWVFLRPLSGLLCGGWENPA
jgi:hypothetical protein